MKNLLRSIIYWQGKAEMALCMFFTVSIVLVIAFQIIARYFFNSPVAWMEEVVTIMFILLTLFAAAVATKEKRHILVDIIPRGRLASVLGIFMSILTIITLVIILDSIAPILKTELRRTTISLPFNFPIAYYNSLPLIYCFCSIILSILYDVLFERKADQEAVY